MTTPSLAQQEQETDKAYAAFKLYFDLGPNRSLRQVSKQLGKHYKVILRWAHAFHWRQRVLAHSAQQLQLERETADSLTRAKLTDWAQRQQEQREAEWHYRTQLLDAAREALTRWHNNPERLESLASIAKVLELASKLGRLATDLATDKAELTGEDGGPIRVELDAALKKIYGRPLPGEVIEVGSAERNANGGEKQITAGSGLLALPPEATHD